VGVVNKVEHGLGSHVTIGIFQKLRYQDARQIAQTSVTAFVSGEVDAVTDCDGRTLVLRRAQDRVVAARPYAATLRQMLANVIAATADNEESRNSPLLANRPEKREWCIQQISGYMSRNVRGRPAFLIHPRCAILVDGLEAGYVFDDRKMINAAFPNIRRAKKDGYYDHLQNTIEYATLNYGTGIVRPERRRPDADYDEDDVRVTRRRSRGRAGY